jgi:hypothetical protein
MATHIRRGCVRWMCVVRQLPSSGSDTHVFAIVLSYPQFAITEISVSSKLSSILSSRRLAESAIMAHILNRCTAPMCDPHCPAQI